MRDELADATAAALARSEGREPRELTDDEEDDLVALATLVARVRSAVERDGYSREIELIPDPEVPTRLVLTLAQLLAGLDVLGVERAEALNLVRSVARDSAPAIRLVLLDLLVAESEPLETTEVGAKLRYPSSTVRRALEDVEAHGLAERIVEGKGKPHSWLASEWTRTHWPVVADLSRNSSSHAERERDRAFTDISGTVDAA
jgi:DNA-binding transcriptional ArsR family regulator